MEPPESAESKSTIHIIESLSDAADRGDQDGIIKWGGELLGSLDSIGPQQRNTWEALARMLIGRVLSDRREYSAAERMFQEAAEAAAREGQTTVGVSGLLSELGVLYRKQGRWTSAEQAYVRAIKAWPPDDDAWCGPLWFDLGEVQERQGKWEHAYFSYREAICRPCPKPEEQKPSDNVDAHRGCHRTVHRWFPLAMFRMVRCGVSGAGGSNWLAFWGKSRGRKWGAGLVLVTMAFFWITAFARFLGVAIPISIGRASFVMPSQDTPAWAFLLLGVTPLAVLILHQLRGVGTQGVQLEQDEPVFPPISPDEFRPPHGGDQPLPSN